MIFLKFGFFVYYCLKIAPFIVFVKGLAVNHRKDKDKLELEVNAVGPECFH